jgi:hypothetical protein
MRNDIKNKLDVVARKDKLLRLKYGLLVIGVFCGYILIMLPYFPSTSTTLKGTAVRLNATQTDEGNMPIMVVRLDNGTIVNASMTKNMQFRRGANVELLHKESITGVNSYAVIKYADSSYTR